MIDYDLAEGGKGMRVMRLAALLLCVVLVCSSCATHGKRVPPGQRAVREVVEVACSKEDLYDAVSRKLLELVDSKRWPPASLSSGGPAAPSVEYQSKDSGRIVARTQIWVDYPPDRWVLRPSGGRRLTEFRLTIQVQEGRYLITADEPRFRKGGGLGRSLRRSEGEGGPRYSVPWGSTWPVDTEKTTGAFRAAVVEVFWALEKAVREHAQE